MGDLIQLKERKRSRQLAQDPIDDGGLVRAKRLCALARELLPPRFRVSLVDTQAKDAEHVKREKKLDVLMHRLWPDSHPAPEGA
jgi:hypothetical protein